MLCSILSLPTMPFPLPSQKQSQWTELILPYRSHPKLVSFLHQKETNHLVSPTTPSPYRWRYQNPWMWKPSSKFLFFLWLFRYFLRQLQRPNSKNESLVHFYRPGLQNKFLVLLYNSQVQSWVCATHPPIPPIVLSHSVTTALCSTKQTPKTDRPHSLASW